jgi:glycosidase
MYTPLGSHDTERLLTKLEGNLAKVKLAYLFQFAYPGAPAVYYGDEIGMTGGKDPECRGAFPWDSNQWNHELRSWVKLLISLRKRLPVMRRGNFRRLFAESQRSCYAFARTLGSEAVLVAMNLGPIERNLRLPVSDLGWSDGRIVRNLLEYQEYIVEGDNLVIGLAPWSGAWIQ